jgi:surface protein
MFYGCSSLTTLDVSKFNTSGVTSQMTNMFNGCSSLKSLDLSNWNTSTVNQMNNMFYGCSELTELTLGNWNTSKVNTMRSMFYGCTNLATLDVSGCPALETLAATRQYGSMEGPLRTIYMTQAQSESVTVTKNPSAQIVVK